MVFLAAQAAEKNRFFCPEAREIIKIKIKRLYLKNNIFIYVMITHLFVKVVEPITKHPRLYLKSQYPVVGASIYTNMVLLEILDVEFHILSEFY